MKPSSQDWRKYKQIHRLGEEIQHGSERDGHGHAVVDGCHKGRGEDGGRRIKACGPGISEFRVDVGLKQSAHGCSSQ